MNWNIAVDVSVLTLVTVILVAAIIKFFSWLFK